MIIKKTMVAAAVGALFMPAVWAQANASSHTGIKNLPAVTVTADAEPAYVVKNSSAGSRTDTPIDSTINHCCSTWHDGGSRLTYSIRRVT